MRKASVGFSFIGAALVSASIFSLTSGNAAGSPSEEIQPAPSASSSPSGNGAKVLPEHPPVATKNFPRNSSGETYGSDAESESFAESPDLIAVVGDSGVFGYCRKDELYPEYSSPQEALEAQASETYGIEMCTVFDNEGQKRLDVLTSTAPK